MDKYEISVDPDGSTKKELLGYSELTRKLLFNRGIKTKKEAFEFLNPDYENGNYDPFLILNMDKAVSRILKAIEKNEKIVIWGDFDCDGISASVVLYDFFKKIDYKNFEVYIPHRNNEGYGLNIEGIEKFAKDGVNLIITVDCGVTDIKEIDLANKLKIDVVITDHHLPQEKIPSAYAVINSKQEDDSYLDDMLAGAGVAFKLVQALIKKGDFKIHNGWEKWLLDVVGLATIADMVPLKKENRIFAYFGLKVLRKSGRAGLVNLMRKTKIDQKNMNEMDISFMIAPRINAAGRMDTPMRAFEMLVAKNEDGADETASKLQELNDERKKLITKVFKEANKALAEREKGDVIVLGNPKWKIGVLGLVANKLVEKYGKTAFVWGRNADNDIKGSCRSDGSVDLVKLMGGVEGDIFLEKGGHEMAGGFSVSHEKIHLLEKSLNVSYQENKKKDFEKQKIFVDEKLKLSDINWDVYSEIEKMAPFGIGNPNPLFLFEDITISSIKKFGKGKEHLMLNFRNSDNKNIPAIQFFVDENKFEVELKEGEKINLVANIEKSFFGRTPELRLRIEDIF